MKHNIPVDKLAYGSGHYVASHSFSGNVLLAFGMTDLERKNEAFGEVGRLSVRSRD